MTQEKGSTNAKRPEAASVNHDRVVVAIPEW